MFDDEGCDLDRVFSWVASLVNPLPDQRITVALGAGYSRATALLPNINGSTPLEPQVTFWHEKRTLTLLAPPSI